MGGWTVKTLRKHQERLLAETVLRMEQRFEGTERAVQLAFAESQRWRDAANEWRGAMSDRDRVLMPRAETERRLDGIEDKVAELRKAVDDGLASRRGARDLWGYLVGAAGLVLALVAWFTR